jgi:hypothetical protein
MNDETASSDDDRAGRNPLRHNEQHAPSPLPSPPAVHRSMFTPAAAMLAKQALR